MVIDISVMENHEFMRLDFATTKSVRKKQKPPQLNSSEEVHASMDGSVVTNRNWDSVGAMVPGDDLHE